ncbi:MAG: tripartite tricarboxylate transporter substrate binding protein [Betaproteobacteria bacterium]|nr:tripartite tricarboxylate transporter substrate binding protein [Betaproteobacteria bacterium]
MTTVRHTIASAILFSLAAPHAGAIAAQDYPVKPVRIMVGYTPGGGVDTAARMMAHALTELWGAQVLVENRPGAAGNIATEATARAAPDGYTLVLCNIGSHAVTPARFGKKLTYDPIGDFAFLAMIGGVPNLFMVHPAMPLRTLKEYLAYARAHPGKLNFGSSGVGASPHMSIELMSMIAGVKLTHVPYKGASAALADAISGHIESSVGNLAGAPLAAVKAGRLRGLGVTSPQRSPQLPEVPTFQEQGVTGFDVTGWYGLCAPAKVPPAVVTKINGDVAKLLAPGTPLHKRFEDQGVTVRTATPEAFAAHVRGEIARWTKVVRETGLAAN